MSHCYIYIKNKKFKCKYIGEKKNFYGEIIFNTSNLGYQEVITDPSYYNQIIVFSNSNIGNTGINIEDIESHRIWAKGIIVKNLSNFYSNFKSKNSIYELIKKNKIIALENKSTRTIIKIIRKYKVKKCVIAKKIKKKKKIKKNYIKKVSTKKSYNFNENTIYKYCNKFKRKILVIDMGLKLNILRSISQLKSYIIVINEKKISIIKKIKPNGIIISNGPGNPNNCKKIIKEIKKVIGRIPILGICLGHQIISICIKKKIKNMKIGHHSSNHPVKIRKKLIITSQNHNYVVKNNNNKIYSIIDKTNQGIIDKKKKIVSFQGHPEACPGTNDAKLIFKIFVKII